VYELETTVQAGEVEPDAPTLEFVEWDDEEKKLTILSSDDGDLMWSVTETAESSPEAVEAGTGASDFGSEAVNDGLNELTLNFPETAPGVHFLNKTLKVGSDFSDVLSTEIEIPEPADVWEILQKGENNNASDISSLPLTFAEAPTSGRLLVACIATAHVADVRTITPPSGFSELSDTGGTSRLIFFRKIAGADEPTTYDFTVSAGSGGARPKGAIYEIQPPAAGVKVEASEDIQTTNGTSLTIGPTTNSVSAGSLAIAALNTASNTTPTESWTNGFVTESALIGRGSARVSLVIAFLVVPSAWTVSTVTGGDLDEDMTGLIAVLGEDD
jgi:hypothetical protein